MKFGAKAITTGLFCLSFLFGAFAFNVEPVFAAKLLPTPTGKCPEDYIPQKDGSYKTTPLSQSCKNGDRDYALNDVKTIISNVGNLILGVSGSIFLFLFVLGGFMYLISAGNSNTVKKGTSIMTSALVGLAFVFGAFTLVTFGVRVLGGSGAEPYIPKAQGPSDFTALNTTEGSVAAEQIPVGIDPVALCGKIGGSCVDSGKCSSIVTIGGICGENKDCCFNIKKPEQNTSCGKVGGACASTSKGCSGVFAQNLCENTGETTQCCFAISK